MVQENIIDVKTRKEWHNWLQQNYDKEKEVWFTYYKKKSRLNGVSYNDAVEMAICFGWIDGKVRRIDEERYIQRFTPRRKGSVWSLLNKNRAKKMIEMNLMTVSGIKTVEEAKNNGWWDKAYTSKENTELPEDVEKALRNNQIAWRNFSAFTNSQQMSYIRWVMDAKRVETRKKRIEELVYRAEHNIKLGMSNVK